jgi:S-adenosylmethionine-diacylglycerol 3-amino-3-carboxypropyl transferase
MMPDTLKFAVVREDPRVEEALVRRRKPEHILCVASGGDTALHLAYRYPEIDVTAFDINPAQLEHARQKSAAIADAEHARLNIDDASHNGLSQLGHFEALFRILRRAHIDLVGDQSDVEAFFSSKTSDDTRLHLLQDWTHSPYWPRIFDITFYHPLLNTMFGPEATQHAEAGSYPRYFRAVFEEGLTREDAATNPFLQHIFLGCYHRADAPDFLKSERLLDVDWIEGTLLDVPGRLDRFGLIHLSNIFDWSSDELVRAWSRRLSEECRPGATIVIRQLNNHRPLESFFEPDFTFDYELGDQLLRQDRSLFYNRILVGRRVDPSSETSAS